MNSVLCLNSQIIVHVDYDSIPDVGGELMLASVRDLNDTPVRWYIICSFVFYSYQSCIFLISFTGGWERNMMECVSVGIPSVNYCILTFPRSSALLFISSTLISYGYTRQSKVISVPMRLISSINQSSILLDGEIW